MNNLPLPEANVHIPYDQKVQPYHVKISDLVCKYVQEDSSVLDIGTGVGHLAFLIREKKPDIYLTIVDIDSHCLNIVQQRIFVNESIQIGEFRDLKNISSKYDAIIMSHILEHLPSPVDAVNLVMKLLNPQGVLILAVPNLITPSTIISNLRMQHYANRGHVCAWDRSHWMVFLEDEVKANVVEYSQDYIPIPVFWKIRTLRPFFVYLAKLFPWFSFSNIAVIKKNGVT